jgi:hypothetical protein
LELTNQSPFFVTKALFFNYANYITTTTMSDSSLQCRCIDIPEVDQLLDTRAYLADMNGEMGWVFIYEGPETEQVRKIIQ